MSYKKFLNMLTAVSGAYYQPAEHDAESLGIQAEFEDRMEACLLNGVISGMACSISSTNILIATGEAYVEGKRYSGVGTVAFAALGNNTYYVYVDPTDNVTPYKAKTSAPTSGELSLCIVTWATPTLSALVDLRQWGIVPAQFECQIVGAVTADQIGFFSVPLDKGFWIDGVCAWATDNGTAAGPTLIDVHAGASGSAPATIFTTQANRISIAWNAADATIYYSSGYPEANRKLAAGSLIVVEVDAAATTLTDLSVCVFGRWC